MDPERRPIAPPTRRRPSATTALIALVVATVVVSSCTANADPGPDPASASGPNAVVVRVVDGDTVIIAIGGREESSRLIGIDTPETKRPDTPIECFGPEASDRLHALLPPATPVRVELDQEPRDRYGRLLVYLHRSADDLFVNELLVRDGFADTLSIAPNTTFATPFAELAATARAERAGLWGACSGPHVPA